MSFRISLAVAGLHAPELVFLHVHASCTAGVGLGHEIDLAFLADELYRKDAPASAFVRADVHVGQSQVSAYCLHIVISFKCIVKCSVEYPPINTIVTGTLESQMQA